MKKISILFFAAIFAAMSCNKEIQEGPTSTSESHPMTFTATTTETRTVLDDDHVSIKWLSTDKISVFDGDGNKEFSSDGEGSTVHFNGNAVTTDMYYAVYPYTPDATLIGTTVRTTLDAFQEPVVGTFADGLNINAAKSASTEFVFDNVLSVAKFTLDETQLGGKTIKSVKFASTYALAGDVVITFSPEGITAAAGDESVKEVTLEDENGLANGAYYFVVLPNAGGDITMTFESTDGFIARKTATLGKAFTAGNIKNLGTVKGLTWTKVFFYESFDKCSGTGGNDGEWSGSIASSNLITDNSGWTFANEGGANKCAKIGSRNSKGTATTPSINNLSGSVNLCFMAGAWSGDNANLVLSSENATISNTSVVMDNAAFKEYDLTLTGASSNTKVTFSGKNASNSRFFLDEVLVYVGDKVLALELVGKEGAPVAEKELNSALSISGNIKKSFNVGDSFSFGDGYVKATYTNGEEKNLTVNDVTVSGFSSSAPTDSQEITLTYTENGKTATGKYNVQIVGSVTGAVYRKVSEFTSGKKYLIVAGNGDSYALPHPGSSGTQAGVEVTISNNTIESTTETDACAFTITYKAIDNTHSYHVISYVVSGQTHYVTGADNTKLGNTTANPALNNNTIWTVTKTTSGQGAFNIKNASYTSRSILWRPFNGDDVFRKFGNYTGNESTGYYNVDLYEYTELAE